MPFFFFAHFSFLVLNLRRVRLVSRLSRHFVPRRLIMRASFGSSRSVGLRIKGRPTEDSESTRPGGGLGSPAAVVVGVLSVGYLPLPGKGKEKISDIRYPCGSKYLRVAVRYEDAVGPSRFEPSFAKTFATCYRPPFGVRI